MGILVKLTAAIVLVIIVLFLLQEFGIAYTQLKHSIEEYFKKARGLVPNKLVIDASKEFCMKLLTLMVAIVMVLVLLALVMTLVGIILMKDF